MQIAWNSFTPWSALAGGLLIGSAAALFLLGSGRIAGITTILASPLHALLQARPFKPELSRVLFLVGLVAAPWLWQLFTALPPATPVAGTATLVAAGLLVGVGTRMANGCTSGHGVCGLSRGSLRSLVNVLVFMGMGMLAVALWRLWA